MAEQTENLGLTVFPDITGVKQRELRQAYDENARLIDAAYMLLIQALDDIPAAVPIATVDTPGKVRPDGVSITIDEDGTLRATVEAKLATDQAAGIVRPDGDTILIDKNGIIKAAVKVAIASTEAAGIVKPDGKSITVEEDGTIKARVTEAYTRTEVDKMLADLSDVLLSEEDMQAIFAATNIFLGENIVYTSLGANIVQINAQIQSILE